jgi:hypothetical protein
VHEIGLPLPHAVVDAVRPLYLWRVDHVAAPEPDIVAAALLLKALSERPDKAPDWLWLVIKNTVPLALIDRLGRLVSDTTVLTKSPAAISRHLSQMIAVDPGRVVSLGFLTSKDDLPLSLAGFAADVDRLLVNVRTENGVSL